MTSAWLGRNSVFTLLLLSAAACSDTNGPTSASRLTVAVHPRVVIVGDTLRLSATAYDASGKPISNASLDWSSSSPSVLSVSNAGLARGVSHGSATVTVTAAGARDTLQLDVTTSFIQLAQGDGNVCGASADGAGYCKGSGGAGELGDGNGTSSADFVRVAGTQTFRGVYPGVEFTCGLGTDSLAYCWGWGGAGSLGTGDTLSHLTPVAVSGGHHFAQIATRGQTACGITAAGSAYCWGWGITGETGDSASTNTLSPTLLPGGHQFIDIATSLNTGCGVTTAHAAYCWGENGNGELGVLTDTPATTPVPLAGAHTFRSVSILDLECGAATDGTAYCWGQGGPYLTPTTVSGGHNFVQVSSTYAHACGITTDSAAYCWEWGLEPTMIAGGPKFGAVASGTYHDCAIAADSSAYCWFIHCDAEWDGGCSTPPTPTAFAAGHRFREIAVSSSTAADWSCGAEADGTTSCWVVDNPALVIPATVPAVKLRSIALGSFAGRSACGIGVGDSLGYCWVLGGQDSVVVSSVAALPGGLQYTSLQASLGHLCGVVVGGSVYCWDGSTPNPVLVPGSSGFVSVTTGYNTNCGLKTDGTVSCWGSNSNGQLGIGYAGQWSPLPLAVSGGLALATIDAAGDHTCGLTTDSVAYCWGSGRGYMLGTGDTASGPTPRAVSTGLKFGSLSLGWELSCALTGDGSAYCWGRGSAAPSLQQNGTKFLSLAADGYSGMCGLTVAGDPLCWDLPIWVAPPRRATAIARR